jgi:Phage tail lysozyme
MATPWEIIQGLVARGIPSHIAQGIAANMSVESGYNTGINEIAPTVAGSRGGYGLNQWTGPRRRQYEAFAAQRGVSPADLDAQLDFTVWELGNTERGAGQALASAQDATTAAQIYSERFLRPGIPHLDRRLAEAKKLAGSQPPVNALAAQPQQPQQQSPFQMPMNDPQQFANALAPLMSQQQQPVFNSLTRRG